MNQTLGLCSSELLMFSIRIIKVFMGTAFYYIQPDVCEYEHN